GHFYLLPHLRVIFYKQGKSVSVHKWLNLYYWLLSGISVCIIILIPNESGVAVNERIVLSR
ncbi:hypothetical protein, partial [Yersinia enterocolitica]|uniref:hypothetical protein n=1 Tax=Yersinia enterocolitica TaxID=630 RepID=UPI00313BBD4B